MKIWKTKVWKPLDITLLKWSSLLFGMIFGAYISPLVKENLCIFIVAGIVCAVRPAVSYWSEEK